MKDYKATELECIQCNKCVINCPLNRVDPSYSSRGYILQALLGETDKIIENKNLYRCLTCYQCKEVCPSKSKYIEFVKDKRKEALDLGFTEECKHGSILKTLQHFQANLSEKQNRLSGLSPETFTDKGDTLYFMGCLPLFDQIFIPTDSMGIAKNVLKILNRSGVKPVVSNEEKCCGYDLLWTGEKEDFEKLARSNITFMKSLGIRRIITSCAECYVTLKEEYPKFGDFNLEVKHITQFVSEALAKGSLKLSRRVDGKVTYHDPCRLGRVGRIFEEPRTILSKIDGITFGEMDRIKENSACCGVGNFSNCDTYTKFLQNERLLEAKETGAEMLLTACPKCRLHFDCYLNGKPIEKIDDLKIVDFTEIIAGALE